MLNDVNFAVADEAFQASNHLRDAADNACKVTKKTSQNV